MTVFYYFGNPNSMLYVETGQAHSGSARHRLDHACQLNDRWYDINIYIYISCQ